MVLFLSVYFALYGGMNLYLFLKVRTALRLQGTGNLLVALFLLVIVLGPVLSRMLDRREFAGAAWVMSLASYLWMAAALWSVVLFALADLWNGLARLAATVDPAAIRVALAPRAVVAVTGLLVLAASLWGLAEARAIRLSRVTVPCRLLPPGSPPLRIAQISDVHLGLLVGEARLRRVMRLVKEASPDLLVSTGDLVDGAATRFNHLAELISSVDAPLGKYAVTGNHEYYAGLEGALVFHRAAGFRMLRGEAVRVTNALVVAGVDDPAARSLGEGTSPGEAAMLPGTERREFCLLLKHRPVIEEGAEGRFDLQLSGHTHRGQIFPFGLLVRLQFPRLSGLFALPQRAFLYVSRGTGTWGPPLRLFSPPEVTLVEVVPQPRS